MDKFIFELTSTKRWSEAIYRASLKGIRRKTIAALTDPHQREHIILGIYSGTYKQLPPHNGYIPKDDGTKRKVRIFEDVDRVLDSVITNILFDKCPQMVHPACYSYQKGIGCADAIRDISNAIGKKHLTGYKIDLSKYFDNVGREYIMDAFDRAEAIMGKSCVFTFLRNLYNDDNYMEYNKETKEWEVLQEFQSLKQGCAIGAWLADVVLYDIDKKLSEMNVLYYRYSDDIIIIGKEKDKALEALKEGLAAKGLTLNPKKMLNIDSHIWFNFLGYEIKGSMISLSKNRIKTFQEEIEKRTKWIHGEHNDHTYAMAVKAVNSYLYGNPRTEHSWGETVLPVINVQKDIDTLNKWVMDCLRCASNGRNKTGGIGGDIQCPDHFIVRGSGGNVGSNRERMPICEGYKTLQMMQNAILYNKSLYYTLRDYQKGL